MRLILIATIGFLMGIMWELYFKTSVALLFFTLIIFLIGYVTVKRNIKLKNKIHRYSKIFINKNNIKLIIIFMLFFLISVLHIEILNKTYNKICSTLSDEKVSFVSTVISDKKEEKYYNVYTVKVIYAVKQNKKIIINKKFLIKVKNKKENLNYGDKIVFVGEFEKATSRSNYKGFSYEEYLKSKGVYGTINISYEEITVIRKNNINIISRLANNFRKEIIKRMNYLLKDDTKDLVLGFLIGYTDEMNENIKKAFRDSSLSHMLAVSGAHVSYIIMGVCFTLNKIKLDKKIAKVITIIILTFFMFVTGFSPSVTRACIMGIIVLISGILYKQTDFTNGICLALLIILIANPFSIYNVGLQLSFGGTIGIVLFSKNMSKCIDMLFGNYTENIYKIEKRMTIAKKHKCLEYIKAILAVILSAQIIIIPITVLNFNTISLTFWISNILASPFMGVIIIGGFIILFISFISIRMSIIFSYIYKFVLNLLIVFIKLCSEIPLSKVYVITLSEITIISYYFIILIINYYFILTAKKNKRSIEKLIYKLMQTIKKRIQVNYKKILKNISIAIIIIFFIRCFYKNYRGLQLYFVDVGQGDCTVIKTPNNKNIIVDGGGNSNSESNYDIGENVVLPYLLNRKIWKLDYMIISHFDSDHYQGLEYVIKNLKVKTVIIPKQLEENYNCKEFLKIAKEKKVEIVEVKAGDRIELDKNLYMLVLWPVEDGIMENITNNNSLVFKIFYNNSSILFTGDIEEVAEKEIISKYDNEIFRKKNMLKADILKVAHHGSKTSSTEEFLKMVKPKIALIGVGKNNKFGHPNEEVIKRISSMGINIFRTDENGEIKIRINKKGKLNIKY